MRFAKPSKRFFRVVPMTVLSFVVPLLCLPPDAEAGGGMTKLGNFSPDRNHPNDHYISVIVSTANVSVRVGGPDSFVQSTRPEVWFLEQSVLSPAYTFKEEHGLKIRFTQPKLDPKAFFFQYVDIYHDGKYWKVAREQLKPLFECKDASKQAEIKNQVLWFDGKNIVKLQDLGNPGAWYTSAPDLEVVLADTFHDDFHLHLWDHSQAKLYDWRGNLLLLYLNDHSALATDALSLESLSIHAHKDSTVEVKSVNCTTLDASAEQDSLVQIDSGHIAKISRSEAFGGKLVVLAQVDKVDGPSVGLTNSQKIIKKQTPQGTILEFPKYGNFDFNDKSGGR
jgi:hypothetical protein